MTRWIVLAAAVLTIAAMTSCRTVVDPLAQDLSADQYFQKAIDASDKDDYGLAMRYYEAFQVKFPADVERNIWASYEIAVLHHKLRDDDTAVALLDKLLARYQAQPANAPPLPPGPRVLAEKVKANILKQRKPLPPKSAG